MRLGVWPRDSDFFKFNDCTLKFLASIIVIINDLYFVYNF